LDLRRVLGRILRRVLGRVLRRVLGRVLGRVLRVLWGVLRWIVRWGCSIPSVNWIRLWWVARFLVTSSKES
jgi:hypothetical protein